VKVGGKPRNAGIFLGLFFDPKNEGDIFLRNIG
jgi:hypothetical protein